MTVKHVHTCTVYLYMYMHMHVHCIHVYPTQFLLKIMFLSSLPRSLQHDHHSHGSPSLREKTLLLTRMMVFYEKRFPDDTELHALFLDIVLFVYTWVGTTRYHYTVNLEIFVVKYFRSQWQLQKLILWKLVHTINANAVKGCSYKKFLHENLSYKSFFTRKFPDLRYLHVYTVFLLKIRHENNNIAWALPKFLRVNIQHSIHTRILFPYIAHMRDGLCQIIRDY